MDSDAYPDVPRELLRRPRRNKRQELINRLVTDGESLLGHLDDFGVPDEEYQWWMKHVMPAVERLRAALALARQGG